MKSETYYLVNYDNEPIIVWYGDDDRFQFIGNECLIEPKEFYKKGHIIMEIKIETLLLNAIAKKEDEIKWLEKFGNTHRSESFVYENPLAKKSK